MKANYDSNITVVAPDSGAVADAEELAGRTDAKEIAFIPKIRNPQTGKTRNYGIIGDDPSGTSVVLWGDIVDSGSTLEGACNEIEKAGASGIAIYTTHALFNPPAQDFIPQLNARIVVTDTVYHPKEFYQRMGVDKVMPMSHVFGEAIKRQCMRGSTKDLYTEEGVKDIWLNSCKD